jgi:hypothetical protein
MDDTRLLSPGWGLCVDHAEEVLQFASVVLNCTRALQ